MGVAIDNIKNVCYSVSEDKTLKTIDIRKQHVISTICNSEAKFTALIYEKDYNRLFVGNKANDIYIYDVTSVKHFY